MRTKACIKVRRPNSFPRLSTFACTLILGTLAFGLTANSAEQAVVQRLKSFGYPTQSAEASFAPLMIGADGALYGTTSGGSSSLGCVFRINQDGSGFTVLHRFGGNGGDGQVPYAGLIQTQDGTLYGTTITGGAYGGGTVFKLNVDGSGYGILHDFGGTVSDGQVPNALMQASDGQLYGLATSGGSSNRFGSIFRLNPNGSSYTNIYTFGTHNDDASDPHGGLIEASNGLLYAVTAHGGTLDMGAIFKINRDGTGYTNIHSFSTNAEDGRFSMATLLQGKDGLVYGAAYSGGSTDDVGMVFKIALDGTGFTHLHGFSYGTGDGQNPALVQLIQDSSGRLFGTTSSGGSNGYGTVFCLNTNGDGFTNVYQFGSTWLDGYNPWAGLVRSSDGSLYGTTRSGGSYGAGIVFKLNPDSKHYTNLHSFSPTGGDGVYPYSGSIQATNGLLYGVTESGGDGNFGTVFVLNSDGSNYTTLHNFGTAITDGQSPFCELLQAGNGLLYGVANAGGNFGKGTVFTLKLDGGGYTNLHSFGSISADGLNPQPRLIESIDGSLSGTAYFGGNNGFGTLFRLNADGTGYTNFYNLGNSSTNGRYTTSPLLEGNDGEFYGTTFYGGNSNFGTIFRVDHDGNNYRDIHVFGSLPSDGRYAYGGLVQNTNGIMYGTTSLGGSNGFGTIYRLNPDASGYTNLHNFGLGTDGRVPYAGLLSGSDGCLYGTTYGGGTNGFGTVYKVNPDGSGYAILYTFRNHPGDGENPNAGLTEGRDGALYGTTLKGGDIGFGTIFRVVLAASILAQPISQTNVTGTTVSFRVKATGTGPLNYRWRKGAQELSDSGTISGSGTDTLTLANVSQTDAGTYSVIVSNTVTSITSANATLVVLTLPRFTEVRRLSTGVAQMTLTCTSNVFWRVEATTNLSSPISWTVVALATTSSGILQISDTDATNHVERFYRAVWVP